MVLDILNGYWPHTMANSGVHEMYLFTQKCSENVLVLEIEEILMNSNYDLVTEMVK